jgi:transcription initiation factor IIE alpha subunit
VIDPSSPAAKDGARFEGARTLAEVWLRRGRVTSEELSQSLSRGLDEFRKNLEALRESPEWAKFRDQLARLAAEVTVAGKELGRLLNEQLPRLQRELDDLYRRYLEELDRERETAPEGETS